MVIRPRRSTSPEGENGARPPTKIFDVDPERRRERERQLAIRQAEQELAAEGGAVKEKQKEDPKAEVGVTSCFVCMAIQALRAGVVPLS